MKVPAPAGLSFLPYQLAGIEFMVGKLKRGVGALLADEMGLGKTIQVIGVLNVSTTIKTVLIVCPKSLVRNWRSELERWLVHPMTVGAAEAGGAWPGSLIVITTYDMIRKWPEVLSTHWDLVVLDEAHMVKNTKTKRAQSIFGCTARRKTLEDGSVEEREARPAIRTRFRIALTGTPVCNRPIELWPIVHWLDPITWDDWFRFAVHFCNAKRTKWGLDVSGARNLDELNQKLVRSCMLRRKKSDVLTDLPEKRRQLIELDGSSVRSKLQCEIDAFREIESFERGVGNMEARKIAFSLMARLAAELAVEKSPAVIEHVEQLLEAGEKVVLFGHHLEAILLYRARWPDAEWITGECGALHREQAVRRFQTCDSVRLFIGGLVPAGVGITLTSARVAVMAEQLWTPGLMDQAEDRIHRIGQRDSVLIQYLVFDQSLDANRCKKLVSKKTVIEQAIG